jgi:tetratricopeptide (TPR) repeat protein
MPAWRRDQDRTAVTLPQRLLEKLSEANSLVRRKRWAEARDLLESLAQRHPRQVPVLSALVNLYYDLQDMPGYQHACERLIRLVPDDPDLALGLAGAYLCNMYPVLGLRTFRRFLERWPNHPRAAEAWATLADLEAQLPGNLAELGLSGEDALELAALHEESHALLERGSYREAREVAEQLLRRRPDFVPALNNVSQIHAVEDRLDQAIATARRVLAIDAENVHALANLARYFCFSGRLDEARQSAARLTAVETDRVDVWLKRAEALSYLGDDQGVVEAFCGAERADLSEPPLGDPLLYHFAAVAAMRLGRPDEARRLWRRALKLAPGLDIAQANLDDLRKPVGEQHAPWAFPFGSLVPRRAVTDLAAQLKRAGTRGDDEAATRAVRRYLRQHPELAARVPLLLDRGDPQGREFALRLARMAETPELLAALRDFALSQRGPDTLRLQAAEAASEAGLLPAGPTRFWLHGEWREALLLGFEVHDEPTLGHEPRVERWLEEATMAQRGGDAAEAERLLQQALEIEPDDPSVLNNLAAAYEAQGRRREAEAIIRRLYERHPDYLFGRVGLAGLHIQKGELEEAQALLDPLMSRHRLHHSEFGALCNAQIELALARGNREAARSWLELWAGTDPDSPAIERLRRRIGQASWPRRLLGRR